MAGRENIERAADLGDDRVPIADRGLAEEPRGRVPRAVVALKQPAPIGRKWQHHPDRQAKRAGEMGDRGVNRDHEPHLGSECGGVAEIVEQRGMIAEIAQPLQRRAIGFAAKLRLRAANCG